ncbi:MAG: alkaline phosphatase family protein [Gemmatimonadaceae bacterium]|nr:alkaline phosphatase family protein [Gemmatimonadaceae bacterium]
MTTHRPLRVPCLRTTLLGVAGAFVLSAPAPRLAAQSTTATPPPPPVLIVQITVDQLRPDYLDKWSSQFTGGFARLLKQGAFFTQAFHDHAATETAPGHATLWSGRTPAHTGVVLNEIGVADPQSPLLFGRGGGASPYRFRGSAFFDWLRTRDQFSRALSVSRKDRGAILPLGRAKQQVYWYSLEGRFTTSRYYADTIPSWVKTFNDRDPVAPYLGAEWTTLLPASAYPEVDSIPYEHGGKDFTFPHRVPTDRRTGTYQFTDYPWMDEITVDFALAGVQALDLGKGPSTDVLSVSLSSTDAIGHAYGPESRELHDQVLRVDRALGRLIDSLYKLRDSTRIVFALGADHGVAPYPESFFKGDDPNRGRVDTRPVMDKARSSLAARGIEGDALLLQSGIVSLDRRRLAAKGVNADSVITALQKQLLAIPGMARVDRVSQLAAKAATGDKIARRWLNAVPSDLLAVLTLTYKPNHYSFTTRYATHGTPYDYDAHIPVLFMGSGIVPGRRTMMVRSVDIAPTLAEISGVEPIEPVDGRSLWPLLRVAPSAPKRPAAATGR